MGSIARPSGSGAVPPSQLRPRYSYGGVLFPSVTQILKTAGLTPFYGHIPKEVLENKANIGKDLHSHAEEVLTEKDTRVFARTGDSYISGWDAWCRVYQPDGIHLERFLTVETPFRFAGQLDFGGTVFYKGARTLAIVDYKTRKPMPGSDGPQTAAYKYGLGLIDPQFAGALRFIAEIGKGQFNMHLMKEEDDLANFFAALRLWHARAKHGLLMSEEGQRNETTIVDEAPEFPL